MNCFKKNIIRIQIFLITTVFLLSFSSGIKADYTSISLSPSSGTIYSDNTAITVLVNSGTDEFIGIDAFLSFTGSVQFVSATGVERCSSFQVIQGSGSINIECFSLAHSEGETYNGTLATLYFKSTGTGTSTFTFTATDPNATTKSGGTYTLTLDPSTGATTPEENSTQTPTTTTQNLPQTSIFDDSKGIFVAGFVLLLFGIFFNQIYSFLDYALEKTFFSSGSKRKSMNEKL